MNRMNWLCAVGMLTASTTASGAIFGDPMGDTTHESVHSGFGGSGENLSDTLANHADPVSGNPTPITHTSGRDLIVGDVERGETPSRSDQLSFQRFHVTESPADLQLTYLGLGRAGFKSIFGVYTYEAGQDPESTSLNQQPLFTQNVDPPGSVARFTVPEDHYFGFYLDANGHVDSAGTYFTENFRNSDNHLFQGGDTDHFLTFNTNAGLLLAMEDLAYRPHTGKLGDQDYEDMLVGFLSHQDGTPLTPTVIPEPATATLLALGGLLLLRRHRRG